MPLYDYKCDKGHKFDTVKSFGDWADMECPECGGRAEYLPFQVGSCNPVIKWWTAPPGHSGFETMVGRNKVPVRPR